MNDSPLQGERKGWNYLITYTCGDCRHSDPQSTPLKNSSFVWIAVGLHHRITQEKVNKAEGNQLQGLQVYGKEGTILHSQLLDPKVVSEVNSFCHPVLQQLLPSINVVWEADFTIWGLILFGGHEACGLLMDLICCNVCMEIRHLNFLWSIKCHWWASVGTSV